MLPLSALFLLIPLKIIALVLVTRGIFSGELKPSRVSLVLWALPSMIGFSIAFLKGAGWSALPIFLAGAAPLFALSISFLSKHHPWKNRMVDYISGCFSILAVILWLVVGNPLLATIFAIIADFFAGVPTFFKAWIRPKTESSAILSLGILGNIIGLSTLSFWNVTTAGFSLYLVFNSVMMLIIIHHQEILRAFSKKK